MNYGGNQNVPRGPAMDDPYAMDRQPFELPEDRQRTSAGISFRTDMGQIGKRDKLFGSGMTSNVVDEERRLIDKVFSIVDADRSGQIEKDELKDMFGIFDIGSEFLDGALSRIWQNVEKARLSGDMGPGETAGSASSISPTEFYKILSQKFNPGDPKREIENVFHKMDKNRDGRLDIDEIHEISQLLGEDVSRDEIKEMLKLFSTKYQNEIKAKERERGQKAADEKKKIPEPTFMSIDDFYIVMQARLDSGAQEGGPPAPLLGDSLGDTTM
jgi:Ca2+-binding EF-hand superfamily protein